MFLDSTGKELKELYEQRDRIWSLTKTNLKMKYGLSKLGFSWSLLEPAGVILVYSLVFPLILGADFYSWVLFFIAGFIPHMFTEDGITTTSQSLVDKKDILNQMNVKEEVIPISTALSNLITFLVACLAFFTMIFASGVIPSYYILIFPVVVIIHFFMVLGIGMFLSITFVEIRDLDHIFMVFFQALLFLTPIIYRLDKIPKYLHEIYLINPFSRLIMLYQKSLLGGLEVYTHYIPTFRNLGLLLLFSVGISILGYWSFKRRKKKYIGEI